MSEATEVVASDVVRESSNSRWLEIAVEALAEFTSTTLEAELEVGEMSNKPGRGYGGYVQLSGSDFAVIVGLVSTDEGADALTRGLLFMEPDEEVTDEDRSDAMGEIPNIFGGSMKTIANGFGGELKLDLPFIVKGRLSVLRGTDVFSRQVRISDIEHTLTVIVRT